MYHDKCYDAAVDAGICQDVAWQYISGYRWECVNATAVCADSVMFVYLNALRCEATITDIETNIPLYLNFLRII
ncbi:hypothetical protein ANCCAN_15297 [Ancylostoma caninum]|uniref:Uncharacterized protein n=1 Tax=Ancylostoma caninum TaxID=29170 RepID=A0A368G722_ANCCA|nr:hypothetical protein ANCCAN_15297 [Ancylostoma caninum]